MNLKVHTNPRPPLSVREECALRFASAMFAGPYSKALLNTTDAAVLVKAAETAFQMAAVFLAVAKGSKS